MKTVAHSLGVKRQTVHRHLAASGTTYSHLLDDVRGKLGLLAMSLDGGRRIAEIGGSAWIFRNQRDFRGGFVEGSV